MRVSLGRYSQWGRKGVFLTEFALTAFVGLSLLMGTITLSYRYFMQARFDDAAREVSRVCLARAGLADACNDIRKVRDMVAKNLGGDFDKDKLLSYGRSYDTIDRALAEHLPGVAFLPPPGSNRVPGRRGLNNSSDLESGSFVAYELVYNLGIAVPLVPADVWNLRSAVVIYNEE
ncbi:MAG: pilus assembly protein [Alphaproteobacteria bacterium GM202ARS2]|nr:pilus assembly protein [Alphaproteobacteria bacterium GM202ARS2]